MSAPLMFTGGRYMHMGPIKRAQYGNGRLALVVDYGDGAPSKLTLNLADEIDQAADEVAIKNYSENDGALDALVRAGIVSEPLRYAPSGHVNVPICKLLVPVDEIEAL